MKGKSGENGGFKDDSEGKRGGFERVLETRLREVLRPSVGVRYLPFVKKGGNDPDAVHSPVSYLGVLANRTANPLWGGAPHKPCHKPTLDATLRTACSASSTNRSHPVTRDTSAETTVSTVIIPENNRTATLCLSCLAADTPMIRTQVRRCRGVNTRHCTPSLRREMGFRNSTDVVFRACSRTPT